MAVHVQIERTLNRVPDEDGAAPRVVDGQMSPAVSRRVMNLDVPAWCEPQGRSSGPGEVDGLRIPEHLEGPTPDGIAVAQPMGLTVRIVSPCPQHIRVLT